MLQITFIVDQENDGIAVNHDKRQVFWDNAPDAWTQYFAHAMPRGVPVLLAFDNGDEPEPDDRPYPYGESNPARLARWLVDSKTDPRIRDEDDVAGLEMTVNSRDLHFLLFQVAERFYLYGVDDVRERHGIR